MLISYSVKPNWESIKVNIDNYDSCLLLLSLIDINELNEQNVVLHLAHVQLLSYITTDEIKEQVFRNAIHHNNIYLIEALLLKGFKF